jgi:hypothetical protein
MTPDDRGMQLFQGAAVYWHPEFGSIAFPIVVAHVIREKRLASIIGFPVSDEQPSGKDGSDSIQFFQGGVVTCRDGKYEVWVRPESKQAVDQNPDAKPESPVEPEMTVNLQDAPAPPFGDYGELTVESAILRLRDLSSEQLKRLLEHEKSHAARADAIKLFEDHIDRLERLRDT